MESIKGEKRLRFGLVAAVLMKMKSSGMLNRHGVISQKICIFNIGTFSSLHKLVFNKFLWNVSGTTRAEERSDWNKLRNTVISDFRCEVDEKCAPVGYYAASSGNFLPTFRDKISVPSSKVYSRSVGKKLKRNNPEERSSCK